MFLDRPPYIYVWKPFYRYVIDGLVGWPFRRLGTLLFSGALPGGAPKDSAAQILRSLHADIAGIAAGHAELVRQNREILERSDEMESRWREVQRSWEASEALWLSLLQDAQRGRADGTAGGAEQPRSEA